MKRYSTIVADPPWPYQGADLRPTAGRQARQAAARRGEAFERARGASFLPYATMSLEEIASLPVADLIERHAHLYLWATNKFLRAAFEVIEAWGFRYSQTLTWCKTPMGLGLGATYASTSEFILVAKYGSLAPLRRHETAWFQWPRTGKAHSRKPEPFFDLIEQVSPGPYLELFARRARPGWDCWGDEAPNPIDWQAAA